MPKSVHTKVTSDICRCVSDKELCAVDIDDSSREDWSRRLLTIRSVYLLLLSAVRRSLISECKIMLWKPRNICELIINITVQASILSWTELDINLRY